MCSATQTAITMLRLRMRKRLCRRGSDLCPRSPDSMLANNLGRQMQTMTYVLQQLLAESAQRDPENVAVWAQTGSLTYRQLEERSNQIAHFICQRGIRKGDRLGLYAPKSADSIAAIFGILKA